MKKKLIGISVASLGMLLSIGGAIALYTRAAEDTGFGISQGTYEGSTGAITYTVNGNTSGTVSPTYLTTGGANGGTGLGGDYTQVEYAFELGAEFSSSLIAQNFVVGNLTVEVTDIPAEYQGKLDIFACVDNYVDGSLGKAKYNHALMNEDFHITSEEGHTSLLKSADVAVSSAGTQVLHVYLKYNLEGIALLDKDEASLGYTLNVAWGEPDSFAAAYVVGVGNMWQQDDKYAMTPNINNPYSGEGDWQWYFNGLPAEMGETKCKIGDNWSQENFTPEEGKSYNVYWSGVAGAAATYQEIE